LDNVFLEPPGVRKNNAFRKWYEKIKVLFWWSEKVMLFGSGLKK